MLQRMMLHRVPSPRRFRSRWGWSDKVRSGGRGGTGASLVVISASCILGSIASTTTRARVYRCGTCWVAGIWHDAPGQNWASGCGGRLTDALPSREVAHRWRELGNAGAIPGAS
jgi:hypothetical protein